VIARVRKALVAALGAAGAALLQAGQDGTLDRGDAVTALIAAVVVGFGAWAIPNAPTVAGVHRLEVPDRPPH
jgi:hypothetical protein